MLPRSHHAAGRRAEVEKLVGRLGLDVWLQIVWRRAEDEDLRKDMVILVMERVEYTDVYFGGVPELYLR